MAEYRSGHNGVVLKTSVSVMSWPVGSNPTSAAILHIPCCILEPGKSHRDFPFIRNDSL